MKFLDFIIFTLVILTAESISQSVCAGLGMNAYQVRTLLHENKGIMEVIDCSKVLTINENGVTYIYKFQEDLVNEVQIAGNISTEYYQKLKFKIDTELCSSGFTIINNSEFNIVYKREGTLVIISAEPRNSGYTLQLTALRN